VGLVGEIPGDQRATRVPDEQLDIDPDLTCRYRGELFSGIAYEETNGVLSEIQYVLGRQHGAARDWASTGQILAETHYYDNTLHGWDRRFDTRGQITEERLFEYGILTRRMLHSPDRMNAWTIAEGDELYPLLVRYRAQLRWPILPAEES
jgi:hypothetical protein